MNLPSTPSSNQRLIIISNRLPVVLEKTAEELTIKPGSGGLVTALEPVLRNRGGMWIGWPGTFDLTEEEISSKLKKTQKSYEYFPVILEKEEVNYFYHGFSNEVIWPLFHDLPMESHFDPGYWQHYLNVNRKYAEAIAKNCHSDEFVWVHDYQLICVAQELKKLGKNIDISFFLHIPFPPLDIFLKLPWRFQIINALLEYDLIGFQTKRDMRNFLQCVKSLIPEAVTKNSKGLAVCVYKGRDILIGSFPISINYKEFKSLAESQNVFKIFQEMKAKVDGQKFVLSVDRLDYTKGIPLRLHAIARFFDTCPEWIGKVFFMQVVIPSRVDIPKYQELKERIDRLVGEINSRYTQMNWVPIHYMFTSLPKEELSAYYRLADVALVTPIKDGMNLVAKEFVASNIDENGVLILSEFAGAATQLYEGALMVNPFDEEGTAAAIHQALTMDLEEQKQRMYYLKKFIRKYDVYWWVKAFLKAAIAKRLEDFPLQEEYNPQGPSETIYLNNKLP